MGNVTSCSQSLEMKNIGVRLMVKEKDGSEDEKERVNVEKGEWVFECWLKLQ